MKKNTTIFFFLFSLWCFSQAKDSIFYYNKSVMVGELKKMKLGKMEFDSDEVGLVYVKNHKIKTFHVDSYYCRTETVDKRVLYGSILTSKNAGCIIVHTLKEDVEIKIVDISSISFYGNGWSDSISGSFGAGYSYTKSSDIGRLNIDGKCKYAKSKWEFQLSANVITTIDSSVVNRENEDAIFSAKYLMGPNWYSSVLLRHQRSMALGLLNRWQEGAGLGYKFLHKQHQFSRAVSGVVVNQEKDLEWNRNVYFEWFASVDYVFFSFSKPNVSIEMSQDLYVSMSQKGRIRNEGDLSVKWELIDDFSINCSFYYNLDTKSPGTSVSKSDYGYVTGVSYKF